MTKKEEVKSFLESQFSSMADANYNSSEWSEFHIHRLHEDSAIVSTLVRHFDNNGNMIVESGSTYTLAKCDSVWKILTLTSHDPSAIIRN